MFRKSGWLAAIGLVVSTTVYVCWDVAGGFAQQNKLRPRSHENVQGQSSLAIVVPGTKITIPESKLVQRVSLRADLPSNLETPRRSAEEASAARLEKKRGRAAKRSETLQAFFVGQQRDSWASQTEIDLRQYQPEGIAFEEISCRSGICRIVASGEDKMKVLDALSPALAKTGMKSFSRVISDADGVVKMEGYMSPGDVKWPRPSFDDAPTGPGNEK